MSSTPEHRKYHHTSRKNHPLNVKGHPNYHTNTHRIVLYDAIGPGPHPCHWCGTPLEWGRGTGKGVLNVDHLDHDIKNNDLSNLVPSCHRCNCSRHNPNTLPADVPTVKMGKNRARAAEKACKNCGETFFYPASQRARKFCSRTCVAQWHTGRTRSQISSEEQS